MGHLVLKLVGSFPIYLSKRAILSDYQYYHFYFPFTILVVSVLILFAYFGVKMKTEKVHREVGCVKDDEINRQ